MTRPHAILAALVAPLLAIAIAHAQTTAIRAHTAHVGDGSTISPAVVIIQQGRIAAVGPDVPIPADATVLDFPHAHITPGLIDANALIEPSDVLAPDPDDARSPSLFTLLADRHDPFPLACDGEPLCPLAAFAPHQTEEERRQCPICGGQDAHDDHFASGLAPGASYTEASSEVVPHTRVLDSLDLRSPDFKRLLAGGVTTVFASPDNAAVIGPRGCILKTAGPIDQRVLVPRSDIKAAFTAETYRTGLRNATPSRAGVSVRTRRPNSRMGIAWVFRKALYDAQLLQAGGRPSGADTAPEPALRTLAQLLDGSVRLRFLARKQADISAALRLAREFGLSPILLEPVEAHRAIDEIRNADAPVIFGPVFANAAAGNRRGDEFENARLSTPALLVRAGITTALSAQDLREEDGLIRQAMIAARAGLDPQHAIAAVTSVPAAILGLDDRLGSITPGKAADLVLWNTHPLDPASKPILVLIDGRTQLDASAQDRRP